MFELDIRREFSAAHQLKGYNGDCSNLHGHNWTVEVFIRSEHLDEVGIALDFKVPCISTKHSPQKSIRKPSKSPK